MPNFEPTYEISLRSRLELTRAAKIGAAIIALAAVASFSMFEFIDKGEGSTNSRPKTVNILDLGSDQ